MTINEELKLVKECSYYRGLLDEANTLLDRLRSLSYRASATTDERIELYRRLRGVADEMACVLRAKLNNGRTPGEC